MRRSRNELILIVLLQISACAQENAFRPRTVVVTRTATDHYWTAGGLSISTARCAEPADRTAASLYYRRDDLSNNRLEFTDGVRCPIEGMVDWAHLGARL